MSQGLANPVKERVNAGSCQFVNQQPACQAGQSHFSENPIIMQSLEGCLGFFVQLPVLHGPSAVSRPRALLAIHELLVPRAPGELFSLNTGAPSILSSLVVGRST